MGLVGISFEQLNYFVLHPLTKMMSHISLLLIVLAVCVYRGLSWSRLQQLQQVLRRKVAITSADSDAQPNIVAQRSLKKAITTTFISAGLLLHPSLSFADVGEAAEIPKVALLTKRSADLQAYSDISRGFKLLRPFGFNEFDGAGGGYLVKFASLFDGRCPFKISRLSEYDKQLSIMFSRRKRCCWKLPSIRGQDFNH